MSNKRDQFNKTVIDLLDHQKKVFLDHNKEISDALFELRKESEYLTLGELYDIIDNSIITDPKAFNSIQKISLSDIHIVGDIKTLNSNITAEKWKIVFGLKINKNSLSHTKHCIMSKFEKDLVYNHIEYIDSFSIYAEDEKLSELIHVKHSFVFVEVGDGDYQKLKKETFSKILNGTAELKFCERKNPSKIIDDDLDRIKLMHLRGELKLSIV